MWNKMRFPVINLGQTAVREPMFGREMKRFSDKDFEEIERIQQYSADILQGVCHSMHYYLQHLRAGSNEGVNQEIKIMNQLLDQLGDNEQQLWIYLISYCDIPAAIIDSIHAMRRKERPARFQRRPIPTRGVTSTPGGRPTRGPGQPISTQPTAPRTPVETPISPRPLTPTLAPSLTPQLPRYEDVATGGAPQYGIDVQRQVESYRQRLEDYYGRPAVTTPGALATLTPGTARPMRPGPEVTAPQMPFEAARPYEIRPRPGGAGTPIPGAPVPTRPSCPPGQFWDGRQCRGSIAPGAEGLISAAAGGAGGMTAMGPGGISTSRGVTSAMSGRYPVVNL